MWVTCPSLACFCRLWPRFGKQNPKILCDIHGNHTVTNPHLRLSETLDLPKRLLGNSAAKKKEFSIRKRTKIYKHISHMICNHKIVQTFFPCFYNWKHVCRGFLLKFETLSCEVSQLPDSQQVELEVRGIKADVKEMTIDRDKYTFNIMISTTRIRIVGT